MKSRPSLNEMREAKIRTIYLTMNNPLIFFLGGGGGGGLGYVFALVDENLSYIQMFF